MQDEITAADDGQLNNVLDNDNEMTYNESCDEKPDNVSHASGENEPNECAEPERAEADEQQQSQSASTKPNRKKTFFNVICVSLVLVLFAITVFVNVFQLCLVVGSSMERTLYDGEFLLMQKVGIEIKRGDIVTVRVKEEDKYPIIKRVIAVKGDRVVFMYDENDSVLLYVDKGNGFELLQENYIKDGKMSYSVFGTFKQFSEGNYRISPNCEVDEIQEGCIIEVDGLFVLGDNRDNSYDSRHYGIIPYKNVQSKVVKELKKGSFAEKILKILFNAN